MNEMNEEKIIRFLNGDFEEGELREFEEWLNADEQNTSLFNSIRDVWLASAMYLKSENFDATKGYKKAVWMMNWRKSKQKAAGRKRKLTLFLTYAAMILVLLSIGAGFDHYLTLKQRASQESEIVEIFSPLGSKSLVTLPDGSKVWINAKSKISYTTDFNKNDRIVDLTGEAYFNVTSNKEKPFIVRTQHLTVRAYGTEFNVAAYPDDDAVSATLVKGNIVVSTEDNNASTAEYHLKQKENITYFIKDKSLHSSLDQEKKEENKDENVVASKVENHVLLKKNIKTLLYTSWKDETWVIEGITLDNLATQLERRFNTRILINSNELKQYKFTGTIRNETLEQVLGILVMTTPMKYKIDVGEVSWDLDKELQQKYSRLLNR